MYQLNVGYSRVDFTPDKPVRMNSRRTGLHVAHNIYATALSFRDQQQRVLLIALDLRELQDHFVGRIRPMVAQATGVPRERIVFVTSHNHSGPDSGAENDPSVMDWRDRIGLPAIVRAVTQAIADEKPLTGMAGGKSISEQISFVRRYRLEDGTFKGIATANPSKAPRVAHESDADLELRTVRLQRQAGKDIVLINYQTHAAGALSVFPEDLNADFVGPLRDKVEAETGALSVYLQGACGNTNYFTKLPEEKHLEKRDYRDAGACLAVTALTALQNSTPLKLGTLHYRSQEFLGDVNHTLDHLAPIAEALGNIEDPQEQLQKMHEAGINNRYERSGILKRAAMPPKRPLELNSIAFGDFAMAFCPHEMFDELGVRLRAISPYAMTFPCNYSQCYRGYMPSHRMVPHGEYEVNMCQYIPGTGEAELLALAAQLQDMKNS